MDFEDRRINFCYQFEGCSGFKLSNIFAVFCCFRMFSQHKGKCYSRGVLLMFLEKLRWQICMENELFGLCTVQNDRCSDIKFFMWNHFHFFNKVCYVIGSLC